MKTIVTTQIEGDGYVARTPHSPNLRGEAATEHEAINNLVAAIRAYGDKPLAWDAGADIPDDDNLIVRHLSGCGPLNPKQPKPESTPATTTEQHHG